MRISKLTNSLQYIMKKVIFYISVIELMAIFLASCGGNNKPNPVYKPTPYKIDIPFGFPTKLNIPADNPMTEEGVKLGRYLFYDGRLSGRTDPDSMMSCSTCHIQKNSFEVGINNPRFPGGFPYGITGKPTPHVMLPMINLVWNSNGYLWNGFVSENNPNPNFRNIEDIVRMGVVSDHEMDGDTTRVKQLFQSLPGYPELFFKAFGNETVTFKNIERAIAQFVRTLISANSKFDKYIRGEVQLSQSELQGFVLFTTEQGADCFHCHGGYGNPLFTTNLFYNNGLDSIFTDPADRFGVTGDARDHGAYKAPTLRNIQLTGPYMRDGRFKTLEEVIDFYSSGLIQTPYVNPLMHHINNGGVQLTPQEKYDLISFLKSLRDDDFLTNPKFAKPEKFPDEK